MVVAYRRKQIYKKTERAALSRFNPLFLQKNSLTMTSIDTLYDHFLQYPVVTTDSRNCPKDSIFIALKGDSFNGNRFAVQALEQGCRYAVIDEAVEGDAEGLLRVENCLETLQALAAKHRVHCGIPVIGITGTNGKTTTKELMAAVMAKKYRLLYTQGNLNNHIGVPLTLLSLRPEHEIAIVEMGANHPGEIRTLAQIADPDFGLITNVGKAHLEGFGSFEGVIRTKGELYEHLRNKGGEILVNRDNPYLSELLQGAVHSAYGTTPHSGLWGEVVSCSPFLRVRFHFEGNSLEAQTQLIGAYNLENVMAAVCTGLRFGVDPTAIVEALEAYVPSNNRSQFRHTEKNALIIDAYNANPTSMTAAVLNFQGVEAQRKVAILGGMKELGDQSAEEHGKLLQLLKASAFERVLLIGNEFKGAQPGFPLFEDVHQCAAFLTEHPLEGCTILLKGSRSNKLETLLPLL
jgi:UDP-N-acetylmuramoyl-tripeptide--D-alanyl-D-alanine ligase